jgi:hypothetical protein
MRIRADLALVSSVLFTIALLNLIPAGRWYFSSPTDAVALARLDAGFRAQLRAWHCFLLILIAVFVWIHAQVYELTPEQLSFWQALPPPPPPPATHAELNDKPVD